MSKNRLKNHDITDPASRAFTGYWDAFLRYGIIEDGRARNEPLKLKDFRERLRGVKKKLSERRRIQLKILKTLSRELTGENELIDLMSGEAGITIPLVLAGRIQKLTLVDDATSKIIYNVLTRLMEVFNLGEKVVLHKETIGEKDFSDIISSVKHVVLAETCLTLPPNLRITQADMRQILSDDPLANRSAHCFGIKATFEDILKTLGGARSRVLHVFDTPYYERQNEQTPNRSRWHVESILDKVGGWKIKRWEAIENDPANATTYGVLEHEQF